MASPLARPSVVPVGVALRLWNVEHEESGSVEMEVHMQEDISSEKFLQAYGNLLVLRRPA